LFATEANIFRFLDEMRQALVKNGNELPWVRTEIRKKFELFYDIIGSEIKGIASNIKKEADEIRKTNKKEASTTMGEPTTAISPDAIKEVTKPVDTPKVVETPTVPVIETPVVVEPGKEEVASPPVETPGNPIKKESELPETTIPTEDVPGEEPTNSNDKVVSDFEGFDDIVKAKTKLDLHKAIYAKAVGYASLDEGAKAIFEVVNVARRDKRYKGKTQIGNWCPTPTADLLNNIKRIVEKGAELANTKVLVS
jgi:uncharacterized phage infection (PIP) family protein YhgE